MSGPSERKKTSGLRERKKERTRQLLSETAIGLFLERGFDAVSVAEIAAAAEVSKPTLFRYFPAKEDLVLQRFADHEDEAARLVTDARAAGVAPLDALRVHFLAGLDRRDPVTGLCGHAAVLDFQRLLYGTPALVARLYGYQLRSEAALADALSAALPAGPPAGLGGDPLQARLVAGQIVAVLRILSEENARRMAAGESEDAVHPEAVEAAELAFRRLEEGIAAHW